MGHGDAGLDAELVGFPGFTLADAFDFRCMQSVELVFVLRLLRADALSRSSKVFNWATALGDSPITIASLRLISRRTMPGGCAAVLTVRRRR